jgi:hypothetical protein
MTQQDEDAAFERALFDAAKHDGPSETQKRAAWQALVGSGALIAVGGTALLSGRTLQGRSGFGLASAKLAAWVAAGALAGSALTLVLLSERSAEPVPAAPTVFVVASGSNQAPTKVVVPTSAAASAEREDPALPGTPVPEPKRVAPMRPQPSGASPIVIRSTLEREVAAVDRARSLLWQGDFDAALHRVEVFHAEFPRSALAADAEAVAIAALRRKGESQAAAGRAERFLLRYPNDPHASRVRQGD